MKFYPSLIASAVSFAVVLSGQAAVNVPDAGSLQRELDQRQAQQKSNRVANGLIKRQKHLIPQRTVKN